MFSSETFVEMADGSKKAINIIRQGDMVMNKFKKPSKVRKVLKFPNTITISIQLNNGTGVFYTTSTTEALCTHIMNNQHKISFCPFSMIHNGNGCAKSSMRSFSPESNVLISNYDDATQTIKDLYQLEISDSTKSFFANGIIVKSN